MSTNSRIITDEKIVPDQMNTKNTGRQTMVSLNLAVYTLFGALERKGSHWRLLLNEAGLEVKGIRRYTELEMRLLLL